MDRAVRARQLAGVSVTVEGHRQSADSPQRAHREPTGSPQAAHSPQAGRPASQRFKRRCSKCAVDRADGADRALVTFYRQPAAGIRHRAAPPSPAPGPGRAHRSRRSRSTGEENEEYAKFAGSPYRPAAQCGASRPAPRRPTPPR